MLSLGILVATLAGLVIVYLRRPHFKRMTLSAARFFVATPDAREQSPRFRLRNLLLSRPFYAQFLALLCLLLAFGLAERALNVRQLERVGVHVLIDRSASMSAAQNAALDAVRAELDALRTHLNGLSADACLRVSVFDLERVTLADDVAPDALGALAADLNARPLGTDLSLLRGLPDDPAAACVITHRMVLSDQPAPDWAIDAGLIWRDVGPVVPNLGLNVVRRSGGGALGWQGALEIDIVAYGGTQPVSVSLSDANGTLIEQNEVLWNAEDRAQQRVTLPDGGTYTVTLNSADAYPLDNQVTLRTPPPRQIRVDWRLNDRRLADALNWPPATNAPDLRVWPYQNGWAPPGDGVPLLLVDAAYGRGALTEIAAFDETSPLLDDLNFDVAEAAQIAGPSAAELAPMRSVMLDTQDRVWIAAAENPPLAYVPGLPTQTGDENLDAFSTTLFFNAARFLLSERELPPLYGLTSPAQPAVDAAHAALHPGEGDTAQPVRSVGDVNDIQATLSAAEGDPLWPLLVVLAGVIVLLERYLSVFGGPRWS